MNEFSFPKTRRLLKAAEFNRVFRRRRSQADAMIVVHACENGRPYARLGLVVSRKCGNAVVRGRWKRRLREAFRLAQPRLPPGVDFVVLPRPEAIPSLAGLRRSLGELAERAAKSLAPATASRPPDHSAETPP